MTEPQEFQKLKERLHNINDWKQEHLKEFAVMQYRVAELEDARDDYATKSELKSSIDSLKQVIEGIGNEVALKISHLHDDIDPIRKAIYWGVSVVICAVILAGLAFILKKPL